MNTHWTGGQYSVFRFCLGIYLAVHFVQLLPYGSEIFSHRGVLPDAGWSPLINLFPNYLGLADSPPAVMLGIGCGAVAALFLAVGKWDRWAALLIWYVWACLFGRNPLISNPSLPYVGWLLLAHATLPQAPYGSWAAIGRPDPGGNWRMHRGIFLCAWILLAVGYTYSGVAKLTSPSWLDGSALREVLENPLARPSFVRDLLLALPPMFLMIPTWLALGLEIAFAPLAYFKRVRPWLWTAMLAMHLGLIVVIDFADLSLGMVLIHGFTFDPAWVKPLPAGAGKATLFYDGQCGLCHRFIRFVLAESADRTALQFAPLQGETFREVIPASKREGLPDSLVFHAPDGRILVKSRAVAATLTQLGGLWTLVGRALQRLPAGPCDLIYDLNARLRHRLFAQPNQTCPLIPNELRTRFRI